MTLQERLRFELCRIADEECYDFGSHQLMMLRQDEARELRSYLDAQERAEAALAEARKDAELGQILMRYIDRLDDPVPDDALPEIVAELVASAIAAIDAREGK